MPRASARLRGARSQREPALAWARSTAAGVIGGFGGIGGFSLRAAAADGAAGRRPGRDLQLAAGPARRRRRGTRRAAADRRPADRRLPRPGLRGMAEEGFVGQRIGRTDARDRWRRCRAVPRSPSPPPSRRPRTRGPQWASLTADQQQALAPLAGEWNKLSLRAQDEMARHRQALSGDEARRAEARAEPHAELGQAHARAALAGARAVPQHRQARARPPRGTAPALGRIPGAAAAREAHVRRAADLRAPGRAQAARHAPKPQPIPRTSSPAPL